MNVIDLSTQREARDELDFWGDIFVANSMFDRLGITFEQFLQHPHSYLHLSGQELPRQEAVIEALVKHKQRIDKGLMDTDEGYIASLTSLARTGAAICANEP